MTVTEKKLQKEFNLLNEPWILAIDASGETKEFSLLEIFEQAHELTSLAGELPTQDVAILRLLLAVLYTTFTRTNERGERAPLRTFDEAVQRWNSLWKLGKFPMEPIEKRLRLYEERFYLFHPERPFYQVAGLDKGTEYKAAKLMGDVSESNNKVRLFQLKNGEAKRAIGFAEAARWLLYLNAFDDTSSKASAEYKKKEKDEKKSPGAGWLGKLGLVYAVGENLFETLMLNFILLDDNGKVWSDGNAVWELDNVRKGERIEIVVPMCPAELLTLQSRRLLLMKDSDKVEGYILLGGDFFSKENAFAEQMTIWRKDQKSRDEIYTPKRHDVSEQLWRSFKALMSKNDDFRLPGVISWLARLERKNMISARQIKIQAASVKYGDKDFFVDDVWGDSFSVNATLLSELGEKWIVRTVDLLSVTENCVKRLGWLASDLAEASGDKNNTKGKRDAAMEEAYFQLDLPFRSWLAAIDPQRESDIDAEDEKWRQQVQHIVLKLGEELIAEAGNNAFVGRSDAKTGRHTAPEAYTKFRNGINKALKK
jgi:CRISPR system Cascade subunit CasA